MGALVDEGREQLVEVGEGGLFRVGRAQHPQQLAQQRVLSLRLHHRVLFLLLSPMLEDLLHKLLREVGQDLNGGMGGGAVEGGGVGEDKVVGVEGDVDEFVE